MHKTERQQKIQDILAEQPQKIDFFVPHFDVDRRTLERDFKEMQEKGHIEKCETTKKYSVVYKNSGLNPFEALVVYMAIDMVGKHAPIMSTTYKNIRSKLKKLLPGSFAKYSESFIKEVPLHDMQEDIARNAERALEIAARAWTENKILSFKYKSSSKIEDKKIVIRNIVINRRNLTAYIFGVYPDKPESIRSFVPYRMQNIQIGPEITSELLAQCASPNLEKAWGIMPVTEGSVNVTLKFTSKVSYLVKEGRYPGIVEMTEQADEGIQLTLEVGADNAGIPLELMPWIYSWGAEVEVLSPAVVREEWLTTIRKLSSLHLR